MWRDRSTNDDARIGQYWDARVSSSNVRAGQSGTLDIDATLAETIALLEARDDARRASPAFATKFEAQFLEIVGRNRAELHEHAPDGPRGLRNMPAGVSKGSVFQLPTNRPPRAWLATSLAAAALIVLAIAGFLYVISERRGDGNVAGNPDVIPAAAINFGVPMDRGNPARSGVMPGPGVSGNLDMRWNFDAGRGVISSPALVGETVFVASGSEPESGGGKSGSVIAIDARDGTELWRFPAEHPINGTPAVTDGIVYASDTNGTTYAIDAETGEEIWSRQLDAGWSSAPVVLNDALFVATAPYRVSLNVAGEENTLVVGSGLVGQASNSTHVFAFDRVTGEERWSSANVLGGKPGLAAFEASSGRALWEQPLDSLESGPSIGEGRVYAASTLTRMVFAVDLDLGTMLWQADIGDNIPLTSSPAISADNVLVTTAGGKLVCLDARSGKERWRATTEHVSLNSSAVVVDETVYVVDVAFGVSAYSLDDGSKEWSESLSLNGQVVDSPIVSSGNLFIVTSLEGEQGHVARLWVFTGSAGTQMSEGEASS